MTMMMMMMMMTTTTMRVVLLRAPCRRVLDSVIDIFLLSFSRKITHTLKMHPNEHIYIYNKTLVRFGSSYVGDRPSSKNINTTHAVNTRFYHRNLP